MLADGEIEGEVDAEVNRDACRDRGGLEVCTELFLRLGISFGRDCLLKFSFSLKLPEGLETAEYARGTIILPLSRRFATH